MQTFQRGFFCSDLSLRYPYHGGTISVAMLLICMLLLPMIFISIVEVMRICERFRKRIYFINLWRSLATFSFGFIATYLSTELAKHVIGRLRPHFYEGCQPRLLDGSTCEQLLHMAPGNAASNDIYVQNYECTNRNLNSRQMAELHVSFPSAHASLSFYSMIFLVIYLHAIWHGRGILRILRHILQFTLLMISWYIALSRVADYWHHWSDVLAGGLLGAVYATLTAIYVGEFLHLRGENVKKEKQKHLLIAAKSRRLEEREQQLICKHMEEHIDKIAEEV